MEKVKIVPGWDLVGGSILVSGDGSMIDLYYVRSAFKTRDDIRLKYVGMSSDSSNTHILDIRGEHKDELFEAIVQAKAKLRNFGELR